MEKYIYEYRGNFLKVHTWRQLEKLSVWAAGVLAAVGAISWYQTAGVCEKDVPIRYAGSSRDDFTVCCRTAFRRGLQIKCGEELYD